MLREYLFPSAVCAGFVPRKLHPLCGEGRCAHLGVPDEGLGEAGRGGFWRAMGAPTKRVLGGKRLQEEAGAAEGEGEIR